MNAQRRKQYKVTLVLHAPKDYPAVSARPDVVVRVTASSTHQAIAAAEHQSKTPYADIFSRICEEV